MDTLTYTILHINIRQIGVKHYVSCPQLTYFKSFSKISPTIFGLAFQAVSFMTCHTKNHKVLVFPDLYCSTIVGLFSRTFFAIFSKSFSLISGASNHFSLIISLADFQVFSISSITIFI